jgi:SPP1 family phage portal protein
MIQAELTGEALTNKEIVGFISQFDRVRFQNNLEYNNGKNVTILSRQFKDIKAPHNNTPVSYARKIINTVVGYMYKPGLITYTSENDKYFKVFTEAIFPENNEELKSSDLGRQASIQGVGYELHYTDGTSPRFSKVAADEMIPVYDYAIEPKLIAAIRHYRRGGEWKVEVYYVNRIDYFTLKDSDLNKASFAENSLVLNDSKPHLYDGVPLVVFENNEERLGDFEPIRPLIDAYDVLVSDSLNEFDRFAWAYLLLKGMQMDKETADSVKQMRIFQNIPTDGEVAFLTKDVPFQFIDFMTGLVRKEIHKQSHVPDFTEVMTGGPLTGAALDRVLYDFELVAATKEALFKKGLFARIDLINSVLSKQNKLSGERRDINIIMNRNKPTSLLELGDAMQRYNGVVSDKTLLENFAPFVKNAQEEIDKRDEENAAKMPNLFPNGDNEDEEANTFPNGSTE